MQGQLDASEKGSIPMAKPKTDREADVRAQDSYIVTSYLRGRFLTASVTAQNTQGIRNNRISGQTVINRLREYGIRARMPYKGHLLTEHHRRQRRQRARTHVRWPERDWQKVRFSDESWFTLTRGDGRHRVYRQKKLNGIRTVVLTKGTVSAEVFR